jgi:hypothetical protein
MREAVIVSTARTPLTKSHRGEFNIIPGPTLAARGQGRGRALGHRPGADRRRHPGLRLPRRHHRPQRGAPDRDPRRSALSASPVPR